MIEDLVRLPSSSTRRNAIRFVKLLERVAPHAVNGFDFEGKFLQPGEFVSLTSLPTPAVLLEGAGSDGSGKKDSRYRYILWSLNRQRGEFEPLAEVWTESWEWVSELGPIARRALEPVRLVPDIKAVALRLEGLIDAELDHLDSRGRAQLATMLHDRIASEMAKAA